MHNTNDKRCIKTKLNIKNALSKILSSKEINQVNVKELCDLAMISRNTFYSHYDNIYSLINEIEEDLLDELVRIIDSTELKVLQYNPYPLLKELTEIIYSDFDLYKIVINSPTSNNLFTKLKELSNPQLFDFITKEINLSEDMILIIIEFYSAGVISAYRQWFNSDRQESLEDISTTISTILSDGLIGIMNTKN
ncbi:MAG: TetR family transcriptional regulator C-terminal domain-containing protein [Clostridia bacterium]|nr:TetR family transcriptional regulator C-terminal domain-containing protein [Clostridia bacterium]